MKNKILLSLAIGILSLIISGCGGEEKENKTGASSVEKLQIVTTFYPMYEFTKKVVGDKADVDLLIPSNIEPHDWEPTPKDMANIQKADLFTFNSESMETWVHSVEESLDEGNKPDFVTASEGITLMDGEVNAHEHEEEHNEEEHEGTEDSHDAEHENEKLDPHVWLSPVLAQKEVQNITDAVVKKDPMNKEYYERNSEAFIKELEELDALYKEKLTGSENKEFITQHAAFGYLAKEYGLKQVPIAGLSPSEEPTPAELAELKKFAEDHEIKVIYFEETTSPKVAKTLAAELGIGTSVLNTLEGLSEDDQKKGLGYIDVMKENLQSLEKTFSE